MSTQQPLSEPAAFRAIVEGVEAETGDRFFPSLVRHLAAALGVQYCFISELSEDRRTRASVRPIFDEHGRIVATRSTHVDITDRKRAEEALRLSEQRLASILDSAMDAILTFDTQCRVELFNDAALMKLRSRRRRREEPIDDLLPRFDADGEWASEVDSWETPSEVLLQQQETRAAVQRCIDSLPERFRTVLLLRDIEDTDTEETAALLGVTPNAVKIRLHRARQAVRTLLEKEFAGKEGI